jgi:hypothetical protein
MADVSKGEAEVTQWYHARIEELRVEYGAADVWGIPRDVFHAAQAEYTERMRQVFGRDATTGEKTPERRKAERVDDDDLGLDDGMNMGLVTKLDDVTAVRARAHQKAQRFRELLDEQHPVRSDLA